MLTPHSLSIHGTCTPSLLAHLLTPAADMRGTSSPSAPAGHPDIVPTEHPWSSLASQVLGLAQHWQGWTNGAANRSSSRISRLCSQVLWTTTLHCFSCSTLIPFYNALHTLCNKYNNREAYGQRGKEVKRFNTAKLEHWHQMRDGKGEGQ